MSSFPCKTPLPGFEPGFPDWECERSDTTLAATPSTPLLWVDTTKDDRGMHAL
jgi:hypothetical protein